MEKNIEEMSVEELKAIGYDCFIEMGRLDATSKAITQELKKRQTQQGALVEQKQIPKTEKVKATKV